MANGTNRFNANDVFGVNPQTEQEALSNVFQQQTVAKPTVGDAAKTGAGLLGGFLAGGPGGMVAVGLMQLAGGILTSMFAEEPRLQLTPEQLAFKRMTKFYGRMGEQTRAMRATVAGYRGVTPEEVTDIGFSTTREMIANVPFVDTEAA